MTKKTSDMNQYRKEYYEANKDKFKGYMTERYTCSVCQCSVAKCRRTVHEKTKKHLRNTSKNKTKNETVQHVLNKLLNDADVSKNAQVLKHILEEFSDKLENIN